MKKIKIGLLLICLFLNYWQSQIKAIEVEQEQFKLTCSIKGVANQQDIFLTRYSGPGEIDTLATGSLIDGKATLKGRLEEPCWGQIHLSGYAQEIIIEAGELFFSLDYKTEKWSYAGGIFSDQLINSWKNDHEFIMFEDRICESKQAVQRSNDSSSKEKYGRAQFEAMQKADRIMREHLANLLDDSDNPNVWLLAIEKLNFSEKEKCLEKLSEAEKLLGSTFSSLKLRKTLAFWEFERNKKREFAIGEPIKTITLTDYNNRPIVFDQVISRNKYTLLEFWFSGCGPCRREFPHLQKVYKMYKPAGFEIIGINADETKELWIKASDEENISWVNCYDENKFEDGGALQLFGVTGFPTSILVSDKGVIVARDEQLRGENLERLLNKLFRK